MLKDGSLKLVCETARHGSSGHRDCSNDIPRVTIGHALRLI